MQSSSNYLLSAVKRAHKASEQLAFASSKLRKQGVMAVAKALESSLDAILEANTLDLETSREMAVPELIVDWLKLTPERLETVICILKQLVKSADPTGKLINAPYQLEPSQTYCQLMPLGTIAFVYEAFPELAAIAAGMSLKTGNSIVLRGCSAASNSNQIISIIMQDALASVDLPPGSIETIMTDWGTTVQDLVTQDQQLNLIVPYGRPSLVQQVAAQATAPVLRTAMGNCYSYWSASGDLEVLKNAIIDSHKALPDAVNAIEKVLIYHNKKASSLLSLFNSLQKQGFQLQGEAKLLDEFPEYLQPIQSSAWKRPYLNKTVAFRYVQDLEEAVSWINQFSSGHADSIVTESYSESHKFIRSLNSAVVYVNTSPRFRRNSQSGEAIFLGMSNQKGYRSGLIGIETFTTVKQVVQGLR